MSNAAALGRRKRKSIEEILDAVDVASALRRRVCGGIALALGAACALTLGVLVAGAILHFIGHASALGAFAA